MSLSVLPEIKAVESEVLRIRRHLHRHPELSHQEFETAKFIAAQLKEWGIPYQTDVGGPGVVGLIEGEAGDGPCVALRGDMDALPITEEREVEYRSQAEGVMHACGHDAHCAMVLGAAKVLNDRRANLQGKMKLLFQPSEEDEPSGAGAMIEDGALKNPDVDAALGLHVFPFLKSGTIGAKSGPAAASADEFEIHIHGKGGHAGYPHLAIDPVMIAAQTITALQTIASRHTRPNDPVVVSVGVIEGAKKANIIPAMIKLRGTFRAHAQSVREETAKVIEKIAKGVAATHGGTAEVILHWGCPPVHNDPAMTDAFFAMGDAMLGEENVLRLPEALMGADDFAHYQRLIPGLMFRLGTGCAEKRTDFPLHHPEFDIDEDTLPTGVTMLVKMTEAICAGEIALGK